LRPRKGIQTVKSWHSRPTPIGSTRRPNYTVRCTVSSTSITDACSHYLSHPRICSGHSNPPLHSPEACSGTSGQTIQYRISRLTQLDRRKIPWRLSPTQKLRHRRRLRRVDNIITVLDSALQRQAQLSAAVATSSDPSSTTTTGPAHSTTPSDPAHPNQVSQSDLQATAQGQRLLAAEANAANAARRHGRGPKHGDILHGSSVLGEGAGAVTTLGDEARRLGTTKLLERWKADMPTEEEMRPKDKYTMFDRKAKGYRKGVHKLPKWTRVSQRLNPPGF